MMIATWKSKVYNNIIKSQRKSKSNKSVECVNGDMSMGVNGDVVNGCQWCQWGRSFLTTLCQR